MYLLQLLIFEVGSNHHLEYNEQLAIGDVAIPVNVIDFKGEPELLFFIPLARESAQAGHKLLKINVTAPVFVENGNHPAREDTLVSNTRQPRGRKRPANLVARGFDETWGRLRNSSRSIVPELS